MPDTQPFPAPGRRPSRFVPIALLGSIAVALLFGTTWAYLAYLKAEVPKPPSSREVVFQILVIDGLDGRPISGATVGLDHTTGDLGHQGPVVAVKTEADGSARLAHRFAANTVLDDDGGVRGNVVFYDSGADPSYQEDYFLTAEAPGYDARTWWPQTLGRGIDFNDLRPLPVTIKLMPSNPPPVSADHGE